MNTIHNVTPSQTFIITLLIITRSQESSPIDFYLFALKFVHFNILSTALYKDEGVLSSQSKTERSLLQKFWIAILGACSSSGFYL